MHSHVIKCYHTLSHVPTHYPDDYLHMSFLFSIFVVDNKNIQQYVYTENLRAHRTRPMLFPRDDSTGSLAETAWLAPHQPPSADIARQSSPHLLPQRGQTHHNGAGRAVKPPQPRFFKSQPLFFKSQPRFFKKQLRMKKRIIESSHQVAPAHTKTRYIAILHIASIFFGNKKEPKNVDFSKKSVYSIYIIY